jgi:hypothetical protein
VLVPVLDVKLVEVKVPDVTLPVVCVPVMVVPVKVLIVVVIVTVVTLVALTLVAVGLPVKVRVLTVERVVVLSRADQTMVTLSETHDMLPGLPPCDAPMCAVKPIIVTAPFVETIGYLPMPLKELKPSKTLTSWPWLLLQKPSKVVTRKIVKLPLPRGRTYVLTLMPLTLILPEVAAAIPGTATTLWTMASPKDVELLMAA